MFFSIIIPLYNRPQEIDELLESLTQQTDNRFEVIVVEDGSSQKSDFIVDKFGTKLELTYYEKSNSGPGLTRNEGAKKARGDYFIFFDSDCIIPPNYIHNTYRVLQTNYTDAYGGPDRAMPTFTTVQKAINYSMTSFFTTGGIRGGKKSMDKFHPRSFNLGVSRAAFQDLGGYGRMRFGEDIDFSLRLIEKGYTTALLADSFVYHKRRTNFRQFFKQVHNSGIARINLHLSHPGSMKAVHALPALFVVGMSLAVLLSVIDSRFLWIPIVYSLLIFIDSWIKNRSPQVAFYSIGAAWTQLFGYGTGFISAAWKRLVLKKGEFKAFEKKFYK